MRAIWNTMELDGEKYKIIIMIGGEVDGTWVLQRLSDGTMVEDVHPGCFDGINSEPQSGVGNDREWIFRTRTTLSMDREAFAMLFGVAAQIVQDWEEGGTLESLHAIALAQLEAVMSEHDRLGLLDSFRIEVQYHLGRIREDGHHARTNFLAFLYLDRVGISSGVTRPSLNDMAARIAAREGGAVNLSIGQIKEVMRLFGEELSRLSLEEAIAVIRHYNAGGSGNGS